MSEHLRVQAAQRMSYEQVRSSDAGVFEQLPQFVCFSLAVTRQWAGFARSIAGTVIGAYARDLRDLSLDGQPTLRRITNARVNHDDRVTLACTVDVQTVCVYIHHLIYFSTVAPAACHQSQENDQQGCDHDAL